MDVSKPIVGKTEVRSKRGVVVAHSPEAAHAGAKILEAGGNAVDALVATSFAAAVREVEMNSIGGVCIMVAHLAKTGQTLVIDCYGRTPKAARADMFVPYLLPPGQNLTGFGWRGTKDNAHTKGYLSAGVPGVVAGVSYLHKLAGTRPLSQLLEPAIQLAEEGFEPTEQITCSIAANIRDLERFPATKAVFLPDGYVPVRMAAGVGQRIVQKDLANTLRLIAKGGADVFYKGSIAKMIGEDFKKHGGIMTADDFAAFQPIINSGLKGKYRGYDIVTTAGPNGGVTFMQTLKILEGFDLKGMGHNSVEYCHVLAEAMRLAWTDRFCYVGDPDQVTFPEAGLVSEAYATVQRRRIRPDSVPTEAKPGDPWPHDPGKRGKPAGGGDPGGHDTTHLSAADTEGNFISLTQTLGSGFGSAVIPEGTGIMLYDVMMWMNPEPGTANSVGPWKRQLGHATPLIIMKDGRPWVSLGAPGGRRVVMAMVQCVINLIDFGMGIQEAIAAPRIFTEGSDPKVPSGKLVNLLEVDDRLSPEVMAGLRAKGHNVVPRHESVAYGHFARPLGVLWAEDGTLRGGVDIFRISTGIGV